jgi:hypothetical protein
MNPRALQAAGEAEARWQVGRPMGTLDGVPATVKDLLNLTGFPTRRGSRSTDTTPASEDAPAVLGLKQAGAVIIGKTTTTEFGWKSPGDCPLHGITRNPWNPKRTPGGSSSGAGAAGAACFGPLHIGTDAGGSIRIPAAYCGLVGMKPSFGRIPHVGKKALFVLREIEMRCRPELTQAVCTMSLLRLRPHPSHSSHDQPGKDRDHGDRDEQFDKCETAWGFHPVGSGYAKRRRQCDKIAAPSRTSAATPGSGTSAPVFSEPDAPENDPPPDVNFTVAPAPIVNEDSVWLADTAKVAPGLTVMDELPVPRALVRVAVPPWTVSDGRLCTKVEGTVTESFWNVASAVSVGGFAVLKPS